MLLHSGDYYNCGGWLEASFIRLRRKLMLIFDEVRKSA